jgi:hypothetical protein
MSRVAAVLRPRAITLLAFAAMLCAPAGRALGDADPPSDFLVTQNVYYPYQPQLLEADAKLIDKLVKRVRAKGFPIKVAVIGSVKDLGGIPQLYGQPANYTNFLHDEITFNKVQPLLVVMPQGFGVDQVGAKGADGLAGLDAPGTDPHDLAVATLAAIARVSTAAGYAVPVPAEAAGASESGPRRTGGRAGQKGTPAIVFVAPVALLALVLLLVTLRDRRSSDDDDDTGDDAADTGDDAAEDA